MYFYDVELSYTIVGAWGLRRLVSGYSGPIIRIRDTVGNAEQDVYAGVDGELNSYTVTGNAAVTKIYDQSGNGADLAQATSGFQGILTANATGAGRYAINFDGSDDYYLDITASTTRPYMVAAPLHVSMSCPKTPRETWGHTWIIPHQDGFNNSPYGRVTFEQQQSSALDWESYTRTDGVAPSAFKSYGFNNRKGFNAHALVGYSGKLIMAGAPVQTFTADTTVTYPNNTRLYLGANGGAAENHGMYWVEHVVYSTTSPVEADIQALVDKISYERLFGPNRFFKMVITGSFAADQYDAGMAEIELHTTVGGSDITDQYTPIIANKTYSSTNSWQYIFDNNNGTWYESGSSPASTTPILWFTSDQNSIIAELKYRARSDGFYAYTAKKYRIYRWTQTGWEQSLSGEIDNTAAGNSASQNYTNSLTWAEPVTQTFTFDYSIPAYSVSSNFTFDYTIVQPEISHIYDFDFRIDGHIDFTFDYTITLYKNFIFNYKIQQYDGDLLGYKHVAPGNIAQTKRAFIDDRIPTVINQWESYLPGSLVYTDVPDLPDVVSVIHDHFYGDYYNRIWVSPIVIRLSNPRIGFEYPFYVWNAYDRSNDMINYVPTDVDGTSFVELGDLPITFGPIEFKTMHFTINEDAPSQIEGNMFFEFTMGGDGFDLFALVLGVLKTLPNEPFNEVWSWFSVLEISRDGTEQRQALRDQPRTQAGYQVAIFDEEDRRIAYQQFYSFATRSIIVPFFQYTTVLTADAEQGDNRLYFDLSKSDVREGEYLILFEPNNYQFELLQVSTLNADGVNLVTPITFDATSDIWEVVPGRNMRLPNKSSLGMDALTGILTFKGETTVWRDLLRPGSVVTLPSYDGYPVIPYEPVADNSVDETFDSDVEVIDNDSAPPELRSTYTNPFIESTKRFLVDRTVEMDWWRTFFDYTKGMLKPFLVPTWREDLPLSETPNVGDNEIVTSNTDYADYWANNTYKYIQIQSNAGTIYRRVEGVNYDEGNLRLSLDDTIGLGVGSNINLVISFLNLTRLNSDEVQLIHYVNHTIIEIETRTVNQ